MVALSSVQSHNISDDERSERHSFGVTAHCQHRCLSQQVNPTVVSVRCRSFISRCGCTPPSMRWERSCALSVGSPITETYTVSVGRAVGMPLPHPSGLQTILCRHQYLGHVNDHGSQMVHTTRMRAICTAQYAHFFPSHWRSRTNSSTDCQCDGSVS